MIENARPPLLITRKTIVDFARPRTYDAAVAFDVALIVGGAAVISVLSQTVLWPSLFGKPFNLQSLGVMLVAFLLGRRRGGLSMALYIVEGLLGVPVFPEGQSGVEALISHEYGYVVGYLFTTYVVGALAEHKWDRWPWTVALAMIVAHTVTYSIVYGWLAVSHQSWAEARYQFNVKHHLIGDFLRTGIAMIIIPSLWWLLEKRRARGGKEEKKRGREKERKRERW
jgi:biotin transport system substrate-specific component